MNKIFKIKIEFDDQQPPVNARINNFQQLDGLVERLKKKYGN